MREADPLELGKRLQEVRGETGVGVFVVVELWTETVTGVVDGVVPTPQNAPIIGGAVVVELVARVADTLTRRPPHRRPLFVGERLRHQYVVVDRNDPVADSRDDAGKCVRGDNGSLGGDRVVSGAQDDSISLVLKSGHLGVLEHSDATLLRRLQQSPGEPGGIDERDRPAVEQPGQVTRRIDPLAHLVALEELDAETVGVHLFRGLAQFRDLMVGDGDIDLSRATKIAVDAVQSDERLDVFEVLLSHGQQRGQFSRPAGQTVSEAVRQARSDEASIATGAAVADAGALDQHDVSIGVDVVGEERGPQSGEPAANHDEVGTDVSFEARLGFGTLGSVEPEHRPLGVRNGFKGLRCGLGCELHGIS